MLEFCSDGDPGPVEISLVFDFPEAQEGSNFACATLHVIDDR
jgi:hypothetical protein